MFPKIDSPCPMRSLELPDSGNFNCAMCKREVHDLSNMDTKQRSVFLSQCEGKVCVSYKVKPRFSKLKQVTAAGVFVLTTSGVALPIAAQDILEDFEDIIVVGGIDNPKTKALEQTSENDRPEESNDLELIPVIEEDDNELGT